MKALRPFLLVLIPLCLSLFSWHLAQAAPAETLSPTSGPPPPT